MGWGWVRAVTAVWTGDGWETVGVAAESAATSRKQRAGMPTQRESAAVFPFHRIWGRSLAPVVPGGGWNAPRC